jgi:rhodanese-related sulfurtransferase
MPQDPVVPGGQTRRTIDEVLDEARAVLDRLEPRAALDAVQQGALIVDIRSDTNRHREGIIPGSLHLPRTVLEWRVDPESPWRNPHVGGLDRHLILVCDHGYSSSLAAATLVQLGFARATDIVGGYLAWRVAGLPTAPAPHARLEPGMGPPDS